MYSFIDIFNGEEAVGLKRIVIPAIQRDYAQGRRDPKIDRVRKRFLESLYNAITDQPITLDFVYGDINDKGVMTPLDGQQRLTTLFLLHWYAAKKQGIPDEESQFLKKFSYETRYSARNFCAELLDFAPSFESCISKEIINQAWFPLDWEKDSTISSMLVMIDAINSRFRDVPNIWDRLKDNAITFYFLPIKDMGLTDELYIKMNSRGKPLTQFEHFKAELERNIRIFDETLAERIIAKIDRDWTDLLWGYRVSGNEASDNNIIDDEFLRYFKFICDVISYKRGESAQSKNNDEFQLLQRYFSKQNEDVIKNISILESFFDCWCKIDGYTSPLDFLTSVMATRHEEGKIVIDNHYSIDIFRDCVHLYLDGNRFPLNRFVLLYAVTCYLRNSSEISHKEFSRRIRIVNNLIQNSADEVSDRSDRNRIPAILEQIDAIIMTGDIDDSIENGFNVNQLQEEKEKINYLKQNPDRAEELFVLEDHPMLKGQISILGLENLDLGQKFESLFSCNWDKIDCAMMCTGDYGQQELNKWRYQYGSKTLQFAWDELFHKSANAGFGNTKKILVQLLASYKLFSNEILEEIIDGFVRTCEQKQLYPWRYYYVKYSVFRPGRYGKLSNNQADATPYMFSVMQTKSQWSQNTYMPYLKAAAEEHLSRDDMGQRLVFGDKYIECTNDSYVVKTNEARIVKTIVINQNEEGIDIEDRIVKLREFIKFL